MMMRPHSLVYCQRLLRGQKSPCRLATTTMSTIGMMSRRSFAAAASSSSNMSCVDLRSDTVTQPSREMLEAACNAPTGDDVLGEDPTVLKLQDYMAERTGMAAALYVPTGTMANLTAITAHCATTADAPEIMIGANSHISLWEGGNVATVVGVHSRQLPEDAQTAQLNPDDILAAWRTDNDDHYPKSVLLCLENTHNANGGAALPLDYMQQMSQLTHDKNMKLHIDGARLCNAAVSLGESLETVCVAADSVSICLSKGLGAPLGSVLVARDPELIRLAKRARKRYGGGMRQAGVVAAMGLYAMQNHYDRLAVDHERAQHLARILQDAGGFELLRNGQVDTNLCFFALPDDCTLSQEEFIQRLQDDYGVKMYGGYNQGGRYFRAAMHLDLTDEDIDRAAHAIVEAASRSS